MPVRILSWNIFNFSVSLWKKAEETTRVLELLHPTGNPPAYDVFVIIEPTSKRVPVGDVAEGAGPDGAIQLLAKLRARQDGRYWRAITPLCIYAKQNKGKGEAVCVLYNSRTVAFVGPDSRVPADEWETLTSREGDVHWVDTLPIPHSLVTAKLHQGRGAAANVGTSSAGSCVEPTAPHLYWLDHRTQGISRCDLDGSNVTALAAQPHSSRPALCVPDAAAGEVYWVHTGTRAIWATVIASGVSEQRVDGATAGQPTELCVANGRLYWIDGASQVIRGADRNGANVANVVLAPQAGVPRFLTAAGLLLAWVATATHTIRVLDLTNGLNSDLVLPAVAGTPHSLCFHAPGLYWVDGASGDLRAQDLGTGLAGTLVPAAGAPSELAVAATGIFWVDGPSIKRANLDGTLPAVILTPMVAPRGLHAGHGHVYWVDTTNHEIHRAGPDGSMAGVCVPAADAGQPRLPRTDNARLYWVDGAANTLRHAGQDGSNPDALPRLGGLVYAHQAHGLFWVDGATNEIWSPALNGTGATRRVAQPAAGRPVSLAASGTHLYWSDASRQELRIAPVAGFVAATCVATADAGQPTSVAVSTRSNKIYWVDGATHVIHQADLDGSNPEEFVEAAAAGTPSHLTAGHDHDFLSWVDTTTHELRWTPLADGDAVQVLLDSPVTGEPGPHRVAPGDSHDPRLLTNVGGGALNWRILTERESCPFLVQFKDLASGHLFNLVAQHAPSPTYGAAKQNSKARGGVSALLTQNVFNGTDPVTRLIYLGDLNLCGVANPTTAPACTNDDNDGHALDRGVLQSFLAAPVNMTLVQHATRSSLKKGQAVWDQYREHAYDNIIAKGHAGVANAGVIDLVDGVMVDYRVAKGLPIGAAIAPNVFNSKSVFLKVRLGSTSGISDHLPVKADFTY